jgi:uncharacterized membrane protein (UPF0127 family)
MSSRDAKLIVNLTCGTVVCERGLVAQNPLRRMRGLIGRSSLPTGEGLLLRPAPSIHTAFMRFPIDAVFLDANLRVVKLASGLKPWRTASSRQARSVLELAAGESERRGLSVDDQLALVEQHSEGAEPGARVLLVAGDRRFRSVASMLLSRRGYSVVLQERGDDIAETAMREHAEVVLIDATQSLTQAARETARLQAVCPSVAVVAVSDTPDPTLTSLPVLLKWGEFGELFDAIERAREEKAERRSLSGTH